jgi:hypothetical protein
MAKNSLTRRPGLSPRVIVAIVIAAVAGSMAGGYSVDNRGEATGIKPAAEDSAPVEGSLSPETIKSGFRGPIRIDSVTTIDSIELVGKELVYEISVAAEPPRSNLDQVKQGAEAMISQISCAQGQARAHIASGGKLTFNYHFPSGRTFTIGVDRCS